MAWRETVVRWRRSSPGTGCLWALLALLGACGLASAAGQSLRLVEALEENFGPALSLKQVESASARVMAPMEQKELAAKASERRIKIEEQRVKKEQSDHVEAEKRRYVDLAKKERNRRYVATKKIKAITAQYEESRKIASAAAKAVMIEGRKYQQALSRADANGNDYCDPAVTPGKRIKSLPARNMPNATKIVKRATQADMKEFQPATLELLAGLTCSSYQYRYSFLNSMGPSPSCNTTMGGVEHESCVWDDPSKPGYGNWVLSPNTTIKWDWTLNGTSTLAPSGAGTSLQATAAYGRWRWHDGSTQANGSWSCSQPSSASHPSSITQSSHVGVDCARSTTANKILPLPKETAFFKPAHAQIFVCVAGLGLSLKGPQSTANACSGGPAKVFVKGSKCKREKGPHDFMMSHNNFTVEKSHLTGDFNLFPGVDFNRTSKRSSREQDPKKTSTSPKKGRREELSEYSLELLQMPLGGVKMAFLDQSVAETALLPRSVVSTTTLKENVAQLELCSSKGFEISMSVKTGSLVKGTLLALGGARDTFLKKTCGGLQFYVLPDGFLGVKNSCDKPNPTNARVALLMYANTVYTIKFTYYKLVVDIYVNGVLRKSVPAKNLLVPCKGQITIGANGHGTDNHWEDPFKFGKIEQLVIKPARKQGMITENGPITEPVNVKNKDLKYLNLNGNFVVEMRVKTGTIVDGELLSLGGQLSKRGHRLCGGIGFFLRRSAGDRAFVGFGQQCSKPRKAVIDIEVDMKPKTWFSLKFEFLNRRAKIYINGAMRKEYGGLPFMVPTFGNVTIGKGDLVQRPFQWGTIKDVYIGATQPPPKLTSPPPFTKSRHASLAASPEVAAKDNYLKVLTAKNTEVKIKKNSEVSTKQFTLSREDHTKHAELKVKEKMLSSASVRFRLQATFGRHVADNKRKHKESTLKSILAVSAKEYNNKVAIRKELTAKDNMRRILEKQEESLGQREFASKARTQAHVRAREGLRKVIIGKEIGDKRLLINTDLRREVGCKATESNTKDSLKASLEAQNGLANTNEKALKQLKADFAASKTKADNDFTLEVKRKKEVHVKFDADEAKHKAEQKENTREVAEKATTLQESKKSELKQKKDICNDRNTQIAKDVAWNITTMTRRLDAMNFKSRDMNAAIWASKHHCITVSSSSLKRAAALENDTARNQENEKVDKQRQKCEDKAMPKRKEVFHMNNQIKVLEQEKEEVKVRAMLTSCSCYGPCYPSVCRQCPLGMTRTNIAKRDKISMQCKCKCGCSSQPNLPEDFVHTQLSFHSVRPSNKWQFTDKKSWKFCDMAKQTNPCAAKKRRIVGKCTKPPFFQGWFRGKKVDVACGCDTNSMEYFEIQTRDEGPLQCAPVEVAPPRTSRFSDWYAICKAGMRPYLYQYMDAKVNGGNWTERYLRETANRGGGPIKFIKQRVTVSLKAGTQSKWADAYHERSKYAAEKAYISALGSPKNAAISSTARETAVRGRVELSFDVAVAEDNARNVNVNMQLSTLSHEMDTQFSIMNRAVPKVIEITNPDIVREHPRLPVQTTAEKQLVMKRQERVDRQTEIAKQTLIARFDSENKQYGYAWAANKKVTIEAAQVYDEALKGYVQCKAVFVSGWTVCAKGAVVTHRCQTATLERSMSTIVPISVGCGCGGSYLQGKFAGLMAQAGATACVGNFEKWARRLRKELYLTGPAQACTARVLKQCRVGFRLAQTSKQARMEEIEQLRRVKKISFDKATRNMNSTINHVVAEQARLHAENANRRYRYNKIAGFGLPGVQKGEPVDNNLVCNHKCGQQGLNCRGYSYNTHTRQCVWSTTGIIYDDNYVLYLRPSGDGMEEGFTAIPGMAIGEVSDTRDPLGESLNDCKGRCMSSQSCRSISYSAHKKHCVVSQLRFEVGSDWDYYERSKSPKQLNERDVRPATTTRVMKKAKARFLESTRDTNVKIAAVQGKLDKLGKDYAGSGYGEEN